MESASFYDTFDLAQITLYLFWIFFAGLIYYLQRESQREGYPVEVDTAPGQFRAKSLMFYPPAKSYALASGETVMAPTGKPDSRAIPGVPTARFPGAPYQPTGANPMLDSIGPGSWAERSDKPDVTYAGANRIVPLRNAPSYHVDVRDPDPRGASVTGLDGVVGGKVIDLWVDLAEHVMRYLEVEVGSGKTARRVLLPVNFTRISRNGVKVDAIKGEHFVNVPGTANADVVTLREEDRIAAYYGAGTLYATPERSEPLL